MYCDVKEEVWWFRQWEDWEPNWRVRKRGVRKGEVLAHDGDVRYGLVRRKTRGAEQWASVRESRENPGLDAACPVSLLGVAQLVEAGPRGARSMTETCWMMGAVGFLHINHLTLLLHWLLERCDSSTDGLFPFQLFGAFGKLWLFLILEQSRSLGGRIAAPVPSWV